MSIVLIFVLVVIAVVYVLNRQRSQMQRIRARRRFEPDWGRSRAGGPRRRRGRFGSLRAEMTQLKDQEESQRPTPSEATPPAAPAAPEGSKTSAGGIPEEP